MPDMTCNCDFMKWSINKWYVSWNLHFWPWSLLWSLFS